MAEAYKNPIIDLVREARERLKEEFRAQAEQWQKLELDLRTESERLQKLESEFRAQFEQLSKIEGGLRDLRDRQQQIETAAEQQLAAFEQVDYPMVSLEGVLSAIQNLMICTMPEQVLQVLTEEAAELGVRAAVFDVRGKAAWGAAASGFGKQLSEKAFRSVIVPLNQDNLFRQVCETGGHVEGNPALLKKTRNVLEKLKPNPQEPILLEPIRSAGAVSAIFYADPGGRTSALPVEALKILSEFAGAQLDRLMALSGGIPSEVSDEETEAPVGQMGEPEAPAEPRPAAATADTTAESPEPWEVAVAEQTRDEPSEPAVETATAAAEPAPALEAVVEDSTVSAESVLEVETLPAPVESPANGEALTSVEAPSEAEATAVLASSLEELDLSQLTEADQKLHKDARRFARLLVSEIELYNKAKVADGRKNKDLYKRLRSDIDRSRQTFEKRFGKPPASQFDYFHDELVKTLAADDPSTLGSDYPGPAA